MEELLALKTAEPPQKHTGFLYELLGGSPVPIYNDVQAHPEKYRPEDVALLEMIISRGPAARGTLTCGCPSEHWDLTEDERKRLDHMTLTFATAERIKPTPVRRPSARPKPKKKEASVTDLPAYWWLKK